MYLQVNSNSCSFELVAHSVALNEFESLEGMTYVSVVQTIEH